MSAPSSWNVESSRGTVVNDPPNWTFGNPNAAETQIIINDKKAFDRLEHTAEITIKTEFFSPNMLERGLPIKGQILRIVDGVFGDHRYTIVRAIQSDPLYFRLTCLID